MQGIKSKSKVISSLELQKRINYYAIHRKSSRRINDIITYLIDELTSIHMTSLLFHTNYQTFKRTIMLKPLQKCKDKDDIEALLRLCKAKFFKSIQSVFRKVIGKKYEGCQLPTAFIDNVTIEDNKKYMDKSIWDIYKAYGLLDEINACLDNPACHWEIKRVIFQLLSMSYEEAFCQYLTSIKFEHDYNSIQYKEGEIKALLFTYISKIYVRYFKQDNIKYYDSVDKTTSTDSL